jgi:alpha-glucosidase
VGEKPVDAITFNIYPDDAGSAAATLYEDDGLSPAYKTGAFRRTNVSVRRGPRGLLVSVGAAEGTYKPGPRKFNFVVKLLRQSKEVTMNDMGQPQEAEIR